MKIGFYSPYVDVLGGGERYVLTLAAHWSKTHDVSLFWNDPKILGKVKERLNLDLSRVRVYENVFQTGNIFRKLAVTRGFDLIFFLTDGSVPTTFAKYNILHFQVPFQQIRVHPIKLSRYQKVVVNSEFTKRNIDIKLGRRSVVIYPPVTAVRRTKTKKKNIILSVGRFHPSKKQDVLIEAFKSGNFRDFTLIIAGGLLPQGKEYFSHLKSISRNLPVTLLPNISYRELTGLYNEALVYWHAAGYRETNPEHMEHFGITTVEAMSAGGIPVVYAGGGLPEIVQEGRNGFLWGNTGELLAKTKRAIAATDMSSEAVKRSTDFDTEIFEASFDRLLAEITQ